MMMLGANAVSRATMKSRAWICLLVLSMVSSVVGVNTAERANASAAQGTPIIDTISGNYEVLGSGSVVQVRKSFGQFFEIHCPQEGWDGVGVLDGASSLGVHSLGVFRYRTPDPGKPGTSGQLFIDWGHPGWAVVTGNFDRDEKRSFNRTWRRVSSRVEGPATPDRPAFGEHVDVDEMPTAIYIETPQYPAIASGAYVPTGTVMVQALVLKDGSVGDTKVVESVNPPFDDAAVRSVRQWRFLPGMSKGRAVAMWVAVPVKFDLK